MINVDFYKNLDLDNLFYIDEENSLITKCWETIDGFYNYKASTFGRFKSCNFNREKRESILRQELCKGYLRITFHSKGKPKRFLSHRVVAKTFIPNPNNKPEVNHIGLYPDGRQGNKLDNRVNSLEWSTKLENDKHSWENNLRTSQKGEKRYNSKITEKQVIEIRAIGNNQTLIKTANEYKISLSLVSAIILRKTWKHI